MDSAKFLNPDPDSVNSDPKHCTQPNTLPQMKEMMLNPLLCLTYGLAVGDEVDHEEADSGGHGRHNHRLHHLQPGPRHVPERTRQLKHHSLIIKVKNLHFITNRSERFAK